MSQDIPFIGRAGKCRTKKRNENRVTLQLNRKMKVFRSAKNITAIFGSPFTHYSIVKIKNLNIVETSSLR